MFWQEDDDQNVVEQVPETVQDLLFSIECKTLPLDHGYALSREIQRYLPWIAEEPGAAIHQIHVAESANGWLRPEDPDNDVLCVSRRTKMTLRLPQQRFDDARELTGKTLNIDGHELTVGEFRLRKLSKLTTVFARYMATGGLEDEAEFLNAMAQQLRAMDIQVKKMMSGKLLQHQTPQGALLTRKLMISDLEVAQSLLLQEQGMGDHQLLGIGVFLPHKGIDAVNKKQE